MKCRSTRLLVATKRVGNINLTCSVLITNNEIKNIFVVIITNNDGKFFFKVYSKSGTSAKRKLTGSPVLHTRSSIRLKKRKSSLLKVCLQIFVTIYCSKICLVIISIFCSTKIPSKFSTKLVCF